MSVEDHTPNLTGLAAELAANVEGPHQSVIRFNPVESDYPRLGCGTCRVDLCSIEDGDTLPVLLSVWVDHAARRYPGDPWPVVEDATAGA
jgi:hypothetical protein